MALIQGKEMPDHQYIDLPLSKGVRFFRKDGIKFTNVPWLIRYHSQDGYEWGYGGSGPADFALNILEGFLRIISYNGPQVTLNHFVCFSLAERLHQPFKRKFIETASRDKPNFITFAELFNFIEQNIVELAKRDS